MTHTTKRANWARLLGVKVGRRLLMERWTGQRIAWT
jgi:hypothetical protein